VVVAAGDVEFSLICLVRVHGELRYISLFFRSIVHFFGSGATIRYLDALIAIGKPLLRSDFGRHIWPNQPILFVNSLIQAYQYPLFSIDQKLPTLQLSLVPRHSIRQCYSEKVTESLYFFQVYFIITRFLERLHDEFISAAEDYVDRVVFEV